MKWQGLIFGAIAVVALPVIAEACGPYGDPGLRRQLTKSSFERFDANKDGKLQPEERSAQRTWVSTMVWANMDAEEMAFDRDGDNKLSEDEYKALWKYQSLKYAAERGLRDKIRKSTKSWFDADKDGKLVGKEIDSQELHVRLSMQAMSDAERKPFDTNRDGVLEGKELDGFMKARADRILAADADGNGKLSEAEVATLAPKAEPAVKATKTDHAAGGYFCD